MDVADLMARQYSVKSGTFRWPVADFYEILNLVSINAYILYKEQTSEKISGIDFIFKLISVAASIALSIRHKFEPDFPCLSHSFMFALFRCSLI